MTPSYGTLKSLSLETASLYFLLRVSYKSLIRDVMKTVRHHLIAQLSRGLQGHFGRVWEGFERLLIRNYTVREGP